MLSKIGDIQKYFYVFNQSKRLSKMLNKTFWFVFVNLSQYVYTPEHIASAQVHARITLNRIDTFTLVCHFYH